MKQRKTGKSLLALLLAVTMLAAIAVPSFAEEGNRKLSVYVCNLVDSGDPEDVWMTHFCSEVLGIDLEVTKYTAENANEFISLAFASNELPDIIITEPNLEMFSSGDLIRYGELEGQIVDLAPYLNETSMPNLSAIYEKYPSYKSAITDSEGHVWSLGFVTNPANNQQVQRVFMNYDWLEECGLEVPKTLDEFTEAMRAFKGLGDNIIPIGGSYTNYNPMIYILNAFGYVTNTATGTDIALRNGEVVLPVADREAYGAYLKYMNMLYTEGLINPDFFTMDATTTDGIMSEGRNGFYCQAPFVFLADSYGDWWGAEPLTSEYNETAQWPISQSAVSAGGVVVTSACEDVETAVEFLDFWYYAADRVDNHYSWSSIGMSSEKYPEYLFGYDGWYYDEQGIVIQPGYEANKDKYASKNDYLFKNVKLWKNCALGSDLNAEMTDSVDAVRPGVADIISRHQDNPADGRHEFALGQYAFETGLQYTVCQVATDQIFPGYVYFDAETQLELNNTKLLIKDYAETESAKFITGARSLDELDDYFDQLDKLGAADYVQTYADYYASIQ